MSQSHLRARPGQSDWMQELEQDAQNFQAVISRLDLQRRQVIADIARKDYLGAGLRLEQMQEGFELVCKLAGIKLNPYVTST